LTPRQAADFLGFREQTLRKWRCIGKGPRFIAWGNTIRYLRADLVRWVAEGRQRSAA
jgi:hypothetical protein